MLIKKDYKFTGIPTEIINSWSLNPLLNINYIFLDRTERDLMLKETHNYLIEKVNSRLYIGKQDNVNLEVEMFHPTKDITLLIKRDDSNDNNQHSNYTNLDSDEVNDYYYGYQNYYYSICYKFYKFQIL